MIINVSKVKKYYLFSLLFLLIFNSSSLFAKPKDSKNTEKKSSEVYTKYVHPREYIFDLADSQNKVALKYDNISKKAYCNVEFTNLVKDQMPRKGDKLTFVYEGTASYDINSITATVYDLTKGENLGNEKSEVFANKVQKNQPFKKRFSVILTDHAEKNLSIRLIASVIEGDKKIPKVINISFKRVSESTNIKKEMEAEKNAIKKGLKIVTVQSDFSEKNNEVTIIPETQSLVQEEQQISLDIEEKTTEIIQNDDAEIANEENTIVTEDVAIIDDITVDEKSVLIAEENITVVEDDKIVEEIIPEEIVIPEEELFSPTYEEFISSLEVDDEEVSVIDEQISLLEESEQSQETENTTITTDSSILDTTTDIATITEVTTTDSTFYLPTTPTVSKYKKEYLQDFAVNEDYELEEETPEVRFFENPNEQDVNGKTMLMEAVKKGDKEFIIDLLNSGADLSLQDKEGWTALMYCARYQKDLACLDLLLEANANVKTKNKYGLSSLVFAATYNTNPKILNKLLAYYSPADKEVLKAFSLLLSECKNIESVQIAKAKNFIEYGVPINAFYNGKTPLMYAAKSCSYTKLINLLLENNAIVTLRSTEGKTAFDYAKINTRLEHDSVYWSLNKK